MQTPSPRRKPPSLDALRAADLLAEREELLIDQLRCVGEASYRQRLEIKTELTKIRSELERLGFGGH
jgi:hypothetical protein